MSLLFAVFCLVFYLFPHVVVSINCTISNVSPRYDTSGKIVNAHDGNMVKFNDTYYLYGTVYENCIQPGPTCYPQKECGIYNNTFSVYSSKDLMKWNLLSNNILPELSKDNNITAYFEANVGYNILTKQYFMIYWSSKCGFINNKVAVAISNTVDGPFKNIDPISLTKTINNQNNIIMSTTALFVDNNNTAYIRYNTIGQLQIIEKLTSNWLNSTGEYSIILNTTGIPGYEGGGTFYRKYNNKYYTILGSYCCFCQWGADAIVLIADNSPLNKWYVQSSNETNYCSNGELPDLWNDHNGKTNPCSPNNYTLINYTIPAQIFSVSTLTTNNGNLFMFNGEHYKSSNDGLKSHDLQTWIPLEFDDDNGGAILPMKWQNQWDVQLV